MKAVLCPVCNGQGTLPNHGTTAAEKPCHGCGGTGWVTVPEDNPCWLTTQYTFTIPPVPQKDEYGTGDWWPKYGYPGTTASMECHLWGKANDG